MRVAVVMYGMLRCFEHTAPFFKRHLDNSRDLIGSGVEFDYFFYGYPNSKGADYCRKKLSELFAVRKSIIVDWNSEIENCIVTESKGVKDLNRRQVGATSPIACLSQHRCRMLSNNLRKSWCTENHVNHDVVILARIDSFFFRDFLLQEINHCIENDGVMIPEDWDFKSVHEASVSDVFAVANETSMNRFVGSYESFPSLVREKGYHFHPETLLGAHMINAGLQRLTCKRHIAFEYPYSEGDVLGLWKETWTKEQVENEIGISVSDIKPDHRKNF